MNRSQVPYGGILLTCAVCVLGVGLNYLMPSQAFEIVLNVASLGIVSTWVIIMICHLVFVRRAKAGLLTRPSFRLPGSPVTEIVTIAFLVAVLGLMWKDPDVGRKTLLLIPVVAAMLVAGWFGVRRRVVQTAEQELTRLGK
jgi:L-asparagine permease